MILIRVASICLATLGLGTAAAAQMTYPLRELEASRRERVQIDNRMKRDRDTQLRKDRQRAATNAREDAATKKATSQPEMPRR
jgi:hypothetical protein